MTDRGSTAVRERYVAVQSVCFGVLVYASYLRIPGSQHRVVITMRQLVKHHHWLGWVALVDRLNNVRKNHALIHRAVKTTVVAVTSGMPVRRPSCVKTARASGRITVEPECHP